MANDMTLHGEASKSKYSYLWVEPVQPEENAKLYVEKRTKMVLWGAYLLRHQDKVKIKHLEFDTEQETEAWVAAKSLTSGGKLKGSQFNLLTYKMLVPLVSPNTPIEMVVSELCKKEKLKQKHKRRYMSSWLIGKQVDLLCKELRDYAYQGGAITRPALDTLVGVSPAAQRFLLKQKIDNRVSWKIAMMRVKEAVELPFGYNSAQKAVGDLVSEIKSFKATVTTLVQSDERNKRYDNSYVVSLLNKVLPFLQNMKAEKPCPECSGLGCETCYGHGVL